MFIFDDRERANLTKGNRRLEKRLKEAMLGIEEERRNTDQYREQVIFGMKFNPLSSLSAPCSCPLIPLMPSLTLAPLIFILTLTLTLLTPFTLTLYPSPQY